MLNLIIKDFAIQKKNIKTYIFIAVFFSAYFLLFSQAEMMMAMVTFPIIYNFLNRALYEDEKNNALRFLVSLPIERDLIVQARYLSVAIVTIVTTAGFWAINRLLGVSGIWKAASKIDFAIAAMITMAFIILISIYLPIAFKLGYIKAVGVNKFIFVGIILVFGMVPILLKNILKGPPPAFIENIAGILSSISPSAMLVFFAAVTLFIYFLSMELSIRFFRKRDLYKAVS